MIPERNILCMPLENQSTSVEFHKKLSCLFDLAEKYGISANYPSGLLADICGDKMTGYVYVEIYERFPSLTLLPGNQRWRLYLPEVPAEKYL